MNHEIQFGDDLGPAQITLGSVVLGDTVDNPNGGTHGGITLKLSTEAVDTFRDAKGKNPHDKIVVGSMVEVTANLTGMSLEQLASLIPGAYLSGEAVAHKRLYFGNPVGTSARANAEALIIKPIVAGVPTTDQTLWVTAPMAYAIPAVELPWSYDDQKVYAITFVCFFNDDDLILWMGKDVTAT